MSVMKSFTKTSARPLPLILLADTSGSMFADGKINALNTAIRTMASSLALGEDLRAEVHLSVITFGLGGAHLHLPLTPVHLVDWSNVEAGGGTPMGAAFERAREMLADRSVISGRAYTPTLVLLSDGQPTDDWEGPLEGLLQDERAQKAFRLSLAIGDDADEGPLKSFLRDPNAKVFRAPEAAHISTFIRLVTMSVQQRSKSATPNQPVAVFEDIESDLSKVTSKIEWDL